MNIEEVTEKQLKTLQHIIGSTHGIAGVLICRLNDVDLTRGRGVLEGQNRCLWTRDGCRITIALASDGGFAASCSSEPDPECPKEPYRSSGDQVQTLTGKTKLPYAGEHPCFGQRQDWCHNMAVWRMESAHALLHFCDECKTRMEEKRARGVELGKATWTRMLTEAVSGSSGSVPIVTFA